MHLQRRIKMWHMEDDGPLPHPISPTWCLSNPILKGRQDFKLQTCNMQHATCNDLSTVVLLQLWNPTKPLSSYFSTQGFNRLSVLSFFVLCYLCTKFIFLLFFQILPLVGDYIFPAINIDVPKVIFLVYFFLVGYCISLW